MFAAILAWACGGEAPKPPAHEQVKKTHGNEVRIHLTKIQIEQMDIKISEIHVSSFLPLINLPGSVAFNENRVSYISSPVEGRVKEALADYGTKVKKGAPLARIESPALGQAQAEFVSAWAAWKAEEPAYERAKALAAERAISVRELQEREARFRSIFGAYIKAKAALRVLGMTEEETTRLEGTQEAAAEIFLRSPLAGEIIERNAAPGQAVGPANRLFTVADLSEVWVFVNLYEKDIAKIRSRQKVFIEASAYPHERFEGTLDFVGQELDEATRTARSRAVVSNSERKLKPGMFVTVTVPLETKETVEALAVPPSALIRVGEEEIAFVETGDGEFKPRHLETGRRFENWVEVLKGLRDGEKVVVEGVFTLKSEWLKDSIGGED